MLCWCCGCIVIINLHFSHPIIFSFWQLAINLMDQFQQRLESWQKWNVCFSVRSIVFDIECKCFIVDTLMSILCLSQMYSSCHLICSICIQISSHWIRSQSNYWHDSNRTCKDDCSHYIGYSWVWMFCGCCRCTVVIIFPFSYPNSFSLWQMLMKLMDQFQQRLENWQLSLNCSLVSVNAVLML